MQTRPKQQRQQRQRRDLSELSLEERTGFAEHLRERIYATLTLLAVMVVMLQHPEEHSAFGVIGTIIGTVVALWGATILATLMSYRIVHTDEDREPRIRETVRASAGLLAPAATPLFFSLFVLFHIISLQTALLIGVISLVLSLFIFSILAGRKSSTSFRHILFYSVLQMGLGVAIVALKLLIE